MREYLSYLLLSILVVNYNNDDQNSINSNQDITSKIANLQEITYTIHLEMDTIFRENI